MLFDWGLQFTATFPVLGVGDCEVGINTVGQWPLCVYRVTQSSRLDPQPIKNDSHDCSSYVSNMVQTVELTVVHVHVYIAACCSWHTSEWSTNLLTSVRAWKKSRQQMALSREQRLLWPWILPPVLPSKNLLQPVHKDDFYHLKCKWVILLPLMLLYVHHHCTKRGHWFNTVGQQWWQQFM